MGRVFNKLPVGVADPDHYDADPDSQIFILIRTGRYLLCFNK